MAKCPAPQGWPKRPSAVTILGPLWPKRASEVTAAKGASPGARQKPRSLMDYSRLRLLFTSRSSPPGRFLATHRHFRGPFWPEPFRIRRHGATFWPYWPILSLREAAVPTPNTSPTCFLIKTPSRLPIIQSYLTLALLFAAILSRCLLRK